MTKIVFNFKRKFLFYNFDERLQFITFKKNRRVRKKNVRILLYHA